MLGDMKAIEKQAREWATKLRKVKDPRFKEDVNALADSLDELIGAAAVMGRKGGAARAKKLSKKRRSEIARKAAKARWAK